MLHEFQWSRNNAFIAFCWKVCSLQCFNCYFHLSSQMGGFPLSRTRSAASWVEEQGNILAALEACCPAGCLLVLTQKVATCNLSSAHKKPGGCIMASGATDAVTRLFGARRSPFPHQATSQLGALGEVPCWLSYKAGWNWWRLCCSKHVNWQSPSFCWTLGITLTKKRSDPSCHLPSCFFLVELNVFKASSSVCLFHL